MNSGNLQYDSENIERYLKKIRELPILSNEEEYTLAKDWRENNNKDAIEKIINSHLKLVAKIANGYRGYGLPISDLIAEGNIGIMNAVKHYDPDRGFRFSTYAMWWIKASIQEYVLYSWSMVKMGTTAAQKKLFFNLRREKEGIHSTEESDFLTNDHIEMIAKKLKVKPDEVRQMNRRMFAKDSSLNTPLGGDADASEDDWIDWIVDNNETPEIRVVQADEALKRKVLFEKALACLTPRENQIISYRRLSDPPLTLEEISQKIGISRERVRQLEVLAFQKLQKRVKALGGKAL